MNVRLRKHDPCNGRTALLRGLDFGRRGSAALPLIAAILFFAVGATAAATNDLSDAEIQGRQLAQQLLEQGPGTNFVQNGVLNIRAGKGKHSEIPVRFQTTVNGTGWQTIYETTSQSNRVRLIVIHKTGRPNEYFLREGLEVLDKGEDGKSTTLVDSKLMTPFAGSDFWVADLGLEFFHWPQQKLLKKEVKRSRGCTVLESTNPNPSTNGYARVVSWIDNESSGIVQAEAYDFKNKRLKEFAPKSFKKVNGQWELQEMEIRNVQTGSRTRLEFDLKKE
ncbi:MAG TPA: outer membrane lipoprotein-sorting protein [Verrucomicrobiae bacterium]|jgi:hypothetical protein